IRPDGTRLVLLVAIGIGVARGVQPMPAPALAVMRGREQAFDDSFVSVRPAVGDEIIYFFDRWRQANEVQAQSADQSRPVRLGRRFELFLLQSRQDEIINRILRPPLFFDRWNRRTYR